MKVTDLYARGATVWALDAPHLAFYVELFGCVALPALLLYLPEIRNSQKGLLWAASISAFGVVFNRFNVSLTSYGGYRTFTYFPSLVEIIITVSLVAGGILIFDYLTKNLPVYKSELT
jgi:Ni/Fe-hydrogenase subunit HybB-like protein